MKSLLPGILLLAASCLGPARKEKETPPPPPSSRPSPASRPAPSPRVGSYQLYVRGDPAPLPCKVKAWREKSLVVEVEKKLFSLVARGESPGAEFPDALLPRGRRVVWRCRVLADSRGILTLALPQEEVRGVLAGRAAPPSGKRTEETGGFRGILLWGTRPLAGARVRAVQLTGRSLIPGILEAPPRLDRAVETRTDEKGRFSFQGLPPGNYKLWIQPRGRKDWIRKIRMVPDVRVLKGRITEMKPFRIRRILGG